MNINIVNYAHYRLSDDGRGHFVLFNRETDKVYDISRTEYMFIVTAGGANSTARLRCEFVERDHESQRIDVA